MLEHLGHAELAVLGMPDLVPQGSAAYASGQPTSRERYPAGMGHRDFDSDRADGWRALLKSLASLDGIAEWQLMGGVTLFMTMPDSSGLAGEGVADTTIRYDEISSIVVLAAQPLGA